MARQESYSGTNPGSGNQPQSGPTASRQTQDDSGGVLDSVTQTASRIADQAHAAAQPAIDMAQERAGAVADQAKEQVATRLDGQKEKATEGLSSLSHAIRTTGQELRRNDQAAVASYTDTAADQIERFTNYLQNRDVSELWNDVEVFARRQPMLFAATAFGLGLAAARFLKSSGQRAYGSGYGDAPYSTTPSRSPYLATPPAPELTPRPRRTPTMSGAPGRPMTSPSGSLGRDLPTPTPASYQPMANPPAGADWTRSAPASPQPSATTPARETYPSAGTGGLPPATPGSMPAGQRNPGSAASPTPRERPVSPRSDTGRSEGGERERLDR